MPEALKLDHCAALNLRIRHIIPWIGLLSALCSCNITQRVPDGAHLLRNVDVEHGDHQLDRYEMEEVLRQRPNQRILGNRLYLRFYNASNPYHIDIQRGRKSRRLAKRNKKREAKGLEPKELKRTWAEWWRDDVGEAPVLLDTALARESAEQLRQYLYKEGYFNAVVGYDVIYADSTKGKNRRKQVDVVYQIKEGEPYVFGLVNYAITHPAMASIVQREMQGSPLVSGERFDMDVLQQEQLRLTNLLRESGYFFFTKDRVKVQVDTSGNNGKGNLRILFEDKNGESLTSGAETVHYTLENIYVNSVKGEGLPTDTVSINDNHFISSGEATVKEKALNRSIFMHSGERYNKRSADNTYARLTGLRTFERVNIQFDTVGTSAVGRLNAFIRVLPAKKQRVSVEGFGTNRGGFFGTTFSLGYQNKNLFKGMESLDLKMNFGFEAQQPITGQNTDGGNTDVSQDVLFNTIEFGPELNLRFPRFLIPFINQEKFAKSNVPRTSLNVLYSFQRRPDFTRILTRGSFGYEWNETRFKRWAVFPIEINEISIPELSAEFRDYLDAANDPVLSDSYTDHFIVGARASYTFNQQDPDVFKRHVLFWRSELETSGNFLRGLFNLVGAPSKVDDDTGEPFFDLGGVRFAQYLKLNNDFRYYLNIHEKSTIVARTSFGAGLPLNNLDVLPFETSFFGGGSNGLRAWRARSIGPGSFSEPLTTFDRIGEIHLEGNLEYRFGLIGFFEGAIFADMGNVWFFKESANRPGSGFTGDFLNELAVGTGLGARLNFDYFLIRFDVGLQTKDPALPQGERWLWQPKDQYEEYLSNLLGTEFTYRPVVNFNLGIGYPF